MCIKMAVASHENAIPGVLLISVEYEFMSRYSSC